MRTLLSWRTVETRKSFYLIAQAYYMKLWNYRKFVYMFLLALINFMAKYNKIIVSFNVVKYFWTLLYMAMKTSTHIHCALFICIKIDLPTQVSHVQFPFNAHVYSQNCYRNILKSKTCYMFPLIRNCLNSQTSLFLFLLEAVIIIIVFTFYVQMLNVYAYAYVISC